MGFFNIFKKQERNSTEISLGKWSELFAFKAGSFGVQGLTPESEGPTNNFDAYATRFYKCNGVVFAVAQTRQRVFSEVTFKWRPNDEPARTHNLFGTRELAILENPWPGGRTDDLLARAIQDVDLAGNFFAVREGTRIRRLRPDWVDIVLSAEPDKAVVSDVVGYIYYPGGYGGQGQPVVYLPEQVAHWAPIPDPHAQYRGMSWITPVIDEITVEKSATKHRISFFKRGAQPSMVVKVKEKINQEQMRDVKQMFMSEAAGLDNQNAPLFVGAGADVVPWESDLSSLDMKNISGRSETHIAAAAGVHPTVVGLSEGLSGSSLNAGNYRVAAKGFINGTMRPLWRSFCSSLETIVDKPTSRRGNTIPARLWFDDSDVSVLNDDRAERAGIMSTEASTMGILMREGFTSDSVKLFVISGDPSVLEHSGLLSVQLTPSAKIGADGEIEYIGPANEKVKAEAEKVKAETDAVSNGDTPQNEGSEND